MMVFLRLTAVLIIVAVTVRGEPQATATPSVSPAPSATSTPSPSAADAEAQKLLKDPEYLKLLEQLQKTNPRTPEWQRAYEKENAYMKKVAPNYSEQLAEQATIKYLRGGGRSGTVSVAHDENALDAVAKATARHDVEGVALMLQSGELFNVPVGTKVRDLGEFHWHGTAKRGMAVTKIRILEGEHYGKAGWVPDQWLEQQ